MDENRAVFVAELDCVRQEIDDDLDIAPFVAINVAKLGPCRVRDFWLNELHIFQLGRSGGYHVGLLDGLDQVEVLVVQLKRLLLDLAQVEQVLQQVHHHGRGHIQQSHGVAEIFNGPRYVFDSRNKLASLFYNVLDFFCA